MSDKLKFKVLQPMKHNGKRLKPDAPVSLTLDQARPLIQVRAIAAVDDDAAAALENQGGGQIPGTEDETTLPAERPENREDVLEAIRQAATTLDPENEDHWTKAGIPDTRALESVLGWEVSAAERNDSGATKPE